MSKLTRIREALIAALPDDLHADALTGPQEASTASKGGLGPARMQLRVYVGDPASETAQKRLDTLLDPDEDGSIPALLYAGDQTLGGLVKGLIITGCSGWRIYQAADGSARLGAEWTIQTR